MQNSAAAVFCALALSAGCGDLEVGCPECTGDVTVAAWWQGSEGSDIDDRPDVLPYLGTLRDALVGQTNLRFDYETSGPDRDIHYARINTQLTSQPQATEASAVTGSLPTFDAFLVNAGRELLRWTPCGNLDGASWLRPLAAALGPELPESYPPEILAPLSCDGELYALPLGIQRANHVLVNTDHFAAYKADALAELDVSALSELPLLRPLNQESAPPRSFFVVPWGVDSEAVLVLTNLMLAHSGVEKYLDYWVGKPEASEVLASAFAQAKLLAPHWNTDAIDLDTALARLLGGDAAMLLTGDWVLAETSGLGARVRSITFPGTHDLRVYRTEAFAMPVAVEPTPGLAWLYAISSSDIQRSFALQKPARPARSDVITAPEFTRAVPELPFLLPPGSAFSELGAYMRQWAMSGSQEAADTLLEYAEQEFAKLSTLRLGDFLVRGARSEALDHAEALAP